VHGMSSSKDGRERSLNKYPIWAPRFWGGMTISGWYRLLRDNGFKVHLPRIGWVIAITLCVPFNSALALLQMALFHRRIERVQFAGPPIFVIGHWRSGTTYLQELLSLNPDLAAPTTYQTYAANHFLVSQWFVRRFLGWMLPSRRPMDDVEISWDSPQEDEWGLSTMGLPSPYHRVAFPRNGAPASDYLDLNLSPDDLSRWSRALIYFLKAVTLSTGKRLVLKSPHHTGRIHVLSRIFPDAKFVHVSRDPYTLLPSTVRMYRAFEESQALQSPTAEGREQFVLETGRRVYQQYFAHRGSLPANRLCEITFDDLTQNPVESIERVYRQLELGDFETARAATESFASSRRSYKKNDYTLSAAWKPEIEVFWKDYFDHFSYPIRSI